MRLMPALKSRLRGTTAARQLLAPHSRRQCPIRKTAARAAVKTEPQLQESGISIAIREPYIILQHWLAVALCAEPKCRPRVACVATVDAAGQPVTRMTSVEQINAAGLTFYSTLGSRLAGEISTNPHASLQFHWPHLRRSVHVAGVVCPVCALQAQLQFARYPRELQLSMHGLPLQRTGICRKIGDHLGRLIFGRGRQQEEVPLPHNWGGFLLKPSLYEFFEAKLDEPGKQCMRFRRCLTLPRGARVQTYNANRYDWIFDSSVNQE